jgi:hypothetical protein
MSAASDNPTAQTKKISALGVRLVQACHGQGLRKKAKFSQK